MKWSRCQQVFLGQHRALTCICEDKIFLQSTISHCRNGIELMTLFLPSTMIINDRHQCIFDKKNEENLNQLSLTLHLWWLDVVSLYSTTSRISRLGQLCEHDVLTYTWNPSEHLHSPLVTTVKMYWDGSLLVLQCCWSCRCVTPSSTWIHVLGSASLRIVSVVVFGQTPTRLALFLM